MTADPPRVTVLMSIYNGQDYLHESVTSILNQTFSDFEFLIVDDGSEDKTGEILEAFRQKDSRIVVIRNKKNMGLTRSLNKGLAQARGEYIARQDADDISLPNRLEKQVAVLDDHPAFVLVSSNIEFIDLHGRPVKRSDRAGDPDLIAWHLIFYNHVAGHSVVMFRRKTVTELGGYAERYRYSQDHELWIRLARVGDIVVLPDVLLQWRAHDENISCKADAEQEAFSLDGTRQRISGLVGEPISLTEAKKLRDFWLGQFDDGSRFRKVHIRLRQIYERFLVERAGQGRCPGDLPRRLRARISRQFYDCSLRINVRQRLLLGFKGCRYAVAWHPVAGIIYGLKETFLFPYYLVRGFARRVSSGVLARF
jgi:glycosyltransferase involved in cell wall biosynthesis